MAFAHSHRKFLLPLIHDSNENPEVEKKIESCYAPNCVTNNEFTSLPPPPPRILHAPKHEMSTILIVVICVLGGAFLFLSYLTIIRFRLSFSRRRDTPTFVDENFNQDFIDENQGPLIDHPIWYIRTIGLSQSVIDSIETFMYKKGDGVIEGSDCSVCLSDFQEDECLRLLPKCSHAFHVNCIDTWLRSHQNCPVCRAPVVVSHHTNNNNVVNDVEMSNMETNEENQTGDQVETRVGLETEDEVGEMRGRNGNVRVLSDLVDQRMKVDQPIRRSVSMDFDSALIVYEEMNVKKDEEGCSDTNNVKIVEKQICDGIRNQSICRLTKSSSYGRSLRKDPISMKRSFSCTSSIRKASSK